MSEDRRGTYRRNAFTFGAIATDTGEIACLVWDVNDGGALIELEDGVALPARVRVRLSPDAPFREATVAWQKAKRVGLSLDS